MNLNDKIIGHKVIDFPKLSIVIPVYNNSKEEVYRCLSHIYNQGYENLEVLFIDDGSSLSCRMMLDELSTQFKFCYVIHQENKGVSAARNKGIALATGEFITFIDADDAYSNYFFSDLKKIFLEYNHSDIDVIYGYARRVFSLPVAFSNYEPIRISNIRQLTDSDRINLIHELIQDHIITFRNKNGYLGCISVGKIVKASIIKETKFNEDLSHNEDNIWNLDLIKISKNCFIIDRCWYYYIYNPKSATHVYNLKILNAYERYLSYLWNNYVDDSNKRICYLKLTIHLALDLKRRAYINQKAPILHICTLFNRSPWNKELNWKSFFSLSAKDKVFYLLIKFKLIDLIYGLKLKLAKLQ